MKVTFLGTGTSQGVPIIGCGCEVCQSTDAHDKRLRSSILLETDTTTIVIDTGPDFRYQMLRAGVTKLDAVVFTHGHKDHVAGLDDVRAYNYIQGKAMEIYATEHTQETLRREFDYVFTNPNYPGIPQLNLNTIDTQPFTIGDITLQPIQVLHYRLPVLGFRVGGFTYITDANYIAPEELAKAVGSQVLVLTALRQEEHISHFSLPQAIDIATQVGATDTYFIHMSHQMGMHAAVEAQLPPSMHLSYDKLALEV